MIVQNFETPEPIVIKYGKNDYGGDRPGHVGASRQLGEILLSRGFYFLWHFLLASRDETG